MLVLGSGGREHALGRALGRSGSVSSVLVAPGNAGTIGDAAPGRASIERRAIPTLTPDNVVKLTQREKVDLVVVGPEAPLCAGVANALVREGIAVFGPSKEAAQIEGSKAFMKAFATRHGIPTAPYQLAYSYHEAEKVIEAHGCPIAVKADGLCGGKGVVIATTREQALSAARSMLVDRCFGDAGVPVILEDVVVGKEASIHAVTDGTAYLVLPTALDYKRLNEGDEGPNTGGMGAVAPNPFVTDEIVRRIEQQIVGPTIHGLRAEGRMFQGVLYAGLMITPAGDPILLEHNARFGDPECQVIMELLEGDIADLFVSAANGALAPSVVHTRRGQYAVGVVLAAQGYPSSPVTGEVMDGWAAIESIPGVVVNHAGTRDQGGRIVTASGRVVTITATGCSLDEARKQAYFAAEQITFNGRVLRRDIGDRLEAGDWRLEAGDWRLETGDWRQ